VTGVDNSSSVLVVVYMTMFTLMGMRVGMDGAVIVAMLMHMTVFAGHMLFVVSCSGRMFVRMAMYRSVGVAMNVEVGLVRFRCNGGVGHAGSPGLSAGARD